jgi:hypothetical protein
MHWQVLVLGRVFEVEGDTANEAKKKAAYLYNETEKTEFPIAFLKAACRVKRMEDKRMTTFPFVSSFFEKEKVGRR